MINPSSITENTVNITQEALTLLATSSFIYEKVGVAKITELLEYCLQAANCRQAVLARELGLSSAAIHRLISHQCLLNLPTLLSLLTHLGLDIANFAQMPVPTLASSDRLNDFIRRLPNKRRSPIQSRLKQGHQASPELLADVQSTLEAALIEDDPPCLKTLAQRVGLTTVNLLWFHYPYLCQAILDKRKSRFNPHEAKKVLVEIATSEAIPPSLGVIASQLNTSPVTLRKYFPEEVDAIKARRYIIKDVTELRHSIMALLEIDPPLSFSEVSRRLGIKSHHIRQQCPDLHQAIVQRFATYRHTHALERKRQSIEAVRLAVASLNANGHFPTKSKVAAMLGRTRWLILNKNERAAFTQMMHELGLQQR